MGVGDGHPDPFGGGAHLRYSPLRFLAYLPRCAEVCRGVEVVL